MLTFFVSFGIIFILLVVMGIIFFCGKGAFLIAGYNTKSAAEKSNFDEKMLCKFMGKLFFSLASSWIIVALGCGLNIAVLNVIGVLLIFLLIIGAAVYANTGNRFKK